MLLPQIIFLLVLVNLPRELLGNKVPAAPGPHAWWWLASLWAGHLLIAAAAWRRGSRAVRALNQTTDSSGITHGIDHLLFYLRWLSIGFTGAHLFYTGLPE